VGARHSGVLWHSLEFFVDGVPPVSIEILSLPKKCPPGGARRVSSPLPCLPSMASISASPPP
jgi:hypothetical protein